MKIWGLLSNVDDIVEEYGLNVFHIDSKSWYDIVIMDYADIRIQNGEGLCIWYDGRQQELPDAFWPMLTNTDSYCLERMLVAAGVPSIINLDEAAVVRSKAATYQRLAANGIRVPKTVIFFNHPDKKLITDTLTFPMVVKPDNGYGGAGVELLHSEEELDAYLAGLQSGIVYMAQEYISTSKGRDLRMMYLEGKFLRCLLRSTDDPNEFRSNVHVGGAAEPFEPDQATIDLGTKIAGLFDLPVLGIDLLFSDDGFVVAEVNGFPGIENGTDEILDTVVGSYLRKTGQSLPALGEEGND